MQYFPLFGLTKEDEYDKIVLISEEEVFFMRSISDIDQNLRVDTEIEREDICFYRAGEEPIAVHGLLRDADGFCRMPVSAAKAVGEDVYSLSRHTAGGRIRFVTDSAYVALQCKMKRVEPFPHMPLTGSSGFDLSVDGVYYRSFVPPVDMKHGYESVIEFSERHMREIEIRFPLYNDVEEVFIGLQKGASVKEHKAYTYQKPVAFYGSSITQGGCVCRPELAYPAILSRNLDFDYRNFGFSGSAKGEEAMADYLNSQDISVLVLDYDHNAPNPEHLEKTHEKFFQRIREKHPELPILILTRPDFRFDPETSPARRAVIERTYQNAKRNGDKKVWYIDGETFFGEQDWDLCAVDACHPNDLGHYRMAQTILPVLRRILEEEA